MSENTKYKSKLVRLEFLGKEWTKKKNPKIFYFSRAA